MIALLGAFFVMVVFIGGGTFMVQPVVGLIIGSMGTISLGVMSAAMTRGFGVFGVQMREGTLTVKQLKVALGPVQDDTLIYVANPTITAAGGLFECQLDGRRVLVIERMAEGVEETVVNEYSREGI